MPGVAVVIANYSILFEVFFFNIVGCFGNVQLLWTTYRKKSTHTKPGILLAINAFYHIICLIGELVNAAFIIRGEHPTRDRCYPLIVVYIFAICQQVFITFVMAVDLLIALLFPMWYRKCSSTPYLMVFILGGTAYALLVSIWGFVAQNSEVILFCNPPLGLANEVSVFWSTSNIIINSLVVVVYVAIIIIVRSKAKGSASHETQRVVRRLSVTAVVFVFSWYMAILGVNLGYAVGLRDEALSLWQSFMVIFALLCFSQTFYVCLWRCAEYRIAFMEQLSIMTCHLINTKPKPSISTSSTTAKVVVQPKSKQ